MRNRLRIILVLALGIAVVAAAADLRQLVFTRRVQPKPAVALERLDSPSPLAPPSPLDTPSPALTPAILLRADGPFVQPPPMGWNGYNRYRTAVTEAIVEANARALVASGMKAAGYDYVNLDGGWDLPSRSADGTLAPDPSKFPHGVAAVAAYVHSLGLKFGIYTSAGKMNCAGTSAGSYGHYDEDAATFASWGVDYLKLDWCYVPYASYPRLSHWQVSRMLAGQMEAALRATGRPIVLDVNDYWSNEQPWLWAPRAGARLYRVTSDIHDAYWSFVVNFERDVALSWRAIPGTWNDPDMLEVGNGGMTAASYRAMFSLWSELAAPLIAGTDLTSMSPTTRAILMNRSVIAVDQDPLGIQGRAVASAGGHWVLTKPLADGSRAVVLFNQTAAPATVSTTLSDIGFSSPAIYQVTDLWTGAVYDTSDVISADVPAGGAVMYRIT